MPVSSLIAARRLFLRLTCHKYIIIPLLNMMVGKSLPRAKIRWSGQQRLACILLRCFLHYDLLFKFISVQMRSANEHILSCVVFISYATTMTVAKVYKCPCPNEINASRSESDCTDPNDQPGTNTADVPRWYFIFTRIFYPRKGTVGGCSWCLLDLGLAVL